MLARPNAADIKPAKGIYTHACLAVDSAVDVCFSCSWRASGNMERGAAGLCRSGDWCFSEEQEQKNDLPTVSISLSEPPPPSWPASVKNIAGPRKATPCKVDIYMSCHSGVEIEVRLSLPGSCWQRHIESALSFYFSGWHPCSGFCCILC